jgi:predicted phosphodiesterase
MKRIVVISDLQIPFEDRKAVDAVAQFIDDYKPDSVISVGDEADLSPLSRYSQGGWGEWAGNLGKERDRVVDVLGMLKVEHITRSNHLDRWFAALARVPAYRDIPEMQLETFFRFDQLGITYHQTPWDPTGTGTTLLMHGDEGSINRKAGMTGLGLALRTQRNVICGHTHRQAVIPETFTWLGDKKPRKIWGFEAGCLADFNSPGMKYAKFKNWQQGFGVVTVEGKTVTPLPIPIDNKSFVVDGVQYKWT